MFRVYLALAAQTIISASTYLVAKVVLETLGPAEIAWLRFVLGGLCYVALFAATGRRVLPPPAELPRVVMLGVVGLLLNQSLFLFGLDRTTPTHTAILYALTPAVVLLGSRVLLGERISRGKAAGLACAFVGVAVVLLEKGLDAARGPLVGDLFVLGAVFAWAAYTVLTRPMARQHGSLQTTGWALTAAAALALPFGPLVTSAERLVALDAATWAGVAFLVVVTSVISYLLWGYALQRLEAAKVAVFANLQPVATAALSWALLGDVPGAGAVVGGLLVIAGVTLTQRS